MISLPSAPVPGPQLDAYLPLAALVAGFGILALSIWHWMEGTDRYHGCKAVDSGKCAGCGYDLTGNVSGRCPECGTPVRIP